MNRIESTTNATSHFVALFFFTLVFCHGACERGLLRAQAPADTAPLSDTDRLRQTRSSLSQDERRLEELNASLEAVAQEMETATAAFESSSATFKQLSELPSQSRDAARLEEAKTRLDEATTQLDLVDQRQIAMQQQKATILERINVQKQLVERMTAPPEPLVSDKPVVVAVPTNDSGTASVATMSPVVASPLLESATAGGSGTVDGKVDAVDMRKEVPLEFTTFSNDDPSLVTLRREVEMKRAELLSLREEITLRDQNIGTLATELETAEKLVATEQEQLQTYQESLRRLRESNESSESAADDSAAGMTADELEERITDTRSSLSQAAEQVQQLREEIASTENLRRDVAERAERLTGELRGLSVKLWFLDSPFAPRSMYRWLITRGPVVIAILLLAALATYGSRFIGRQIVSGLVRRSRRGNQTEREERAETLRRVFQSAVQTVIVILVALALLQQMGVDVTVLVGGAAVIGMAIAFGAQNLIKDYFTGFMILVENQYSVGNVIRINGVTGVVENISMRMTVLRDIEGIVHFIPHGNVTMVSNLTHGWSRVSLDISVGYSEDVDRVIEVLHDLLVELRDDPKFGPMILGEPEIAGVESLADSAVLIKVLIKTRPLKQWEVKREMLRRTKKRFDKLGIEIPFPSRTLIVRNEERKA